MLTGSILCQDKRRNDSILESARFGHLDIVSEKVLFLSIFHVIPIEMVRIQSVSCQLIGLFGVGMKDGQTDKFSL